MRINHLLLTLLFIVPVLLLACLSSEAQDTTSSDPKLINVPNPVYPTNTSTLVPTGMIYVSVDVDKRGFVKDTEDVDGPGGVCPQVNTPEVAAVRVAAKDAAMKAKFTPALINGKPTAGQAIIDFQFGTPPPVKSDDRRPSDPGSAKLEMRMSTDNKTPQSGAQTKLVSGGVLNGSAMILTTPKYPPAAKAVRAAGPVSIQVVITEAGDVFSAVAVSGHPLLRAGSRLAACSSKFTPTMLLGQPVKVVGVITYNYNL